MSILTPKFRSIEYYSDIPKDLALLPGRDDLSRKINENAVRESIKNIVLTSPGEKLFDPTFGCGIKGMMFEQLDPTVLRIVKDKVISAITTFEPRCEVASVEVSSDVGENSLFVNIFFRVLNTDTTSSVQINIERVR